MVRPSALKVTVETSAARCRPPAVVIELFDHDGSRVAVASSRAARLVSTVAYKADGLTERVGTSPFGTDTVRDRFQGLLFGPTAVFYHN